MKEGDPTLFFDTDDSTTAFQEPNIPWRKSRARKILYTDIKEGRVPRSAKDENGRRTTDIKTVYLMHPEYALWDYNKFSSRLAGVRKIIGGKDARAQDDQNVFDLFVENNEIHSFSRKGYIQWKGSESQRLLKKDIQDGIVRQYGSRKKDLWLSRPEYHLEFPLDAFRDKIKQEIGTAKYLHTLKVKGKAERSYKYN